MMYNVLEYAYECICTISAHAHADMYITAVVQCAWSSIYIHHVSLVVVQAGAGAGRERRRAKKEEGEEEGTNGSEG